MPLVLLRVDQRLIHGQVVHGWGNQLRPERYLVVDDELAVSEWEQDLYRLGSGDVPAEFATVQEAREALQGWKDAPTRSVLLLRDLDTLQELARGGVLAGQEVNLGGIHHAPGLHEVLPYLHLSDLDRDRLRVLAEEGARISARDLPDSHAVPLAELLER